MKPTKIRKCAKQSYEYPVNEESFRVDDESPQFDVNRDYNFSSMTEKVMRDVFL